MGQTRRDYRVWEAALSLEDCAAHTNGTSERKQAGDIIAVRRPGSAIGRKEAHRVLWLRLDGLDENQMARLLDELGPDEHGGGPRFDKRRFCIPLARLAKVVPGFDVAAALDRTRIYQPFLTVDTEDFAFLAAAPSLPVEGLVFDKQTGRYL